MEPASKRPIQTTPRFTSLELGLRILSYGSPRSGLFARLFSVIGR